MSEQGTITASPSRRSKSTTPRKRLSAIFGKSSGQETTSSSQSEERISSQVLQSTPVKASLSGPEGSFGLDGSSQRKLGSPARSPRKSPYGRRSSGKKKAAAQREAKTEKAQVLSPFGFSPALFLPPSVLPTSHSFEASLSPSELDSSQPPPLPSVPPPGTTGITLQSPHKGTYSCTSVLCFLLFKSKLKLNVWCKCCGGVTM